MQSKAGAHLEKKTRAEESHGLPRGRSSRYGEREASAAAASYSAGGGVGRD